MTHANIRHGGNVQYMRVTPAERIMGALVTCLTAFLAVVLFTFAASLIWNDIRIAEVTL